MSDAAGIRAAPKLRAIVIGAAAALLAAPVVACGLIVVVTFLAGPHSSVLPSAVQPAVLLLGWLALPAIPIALGIRVFRRVRAHAAGRPRIDGRRG